MKVNDPITESQSNAQDKAQERGQPENIANLMLGSLENISVHIHEYVYAEIYKAQQAYRQNVEPIFKLIDQCHERVSELHPLLEKLNKNRLYLIDLSKEIRLNEMDILLATNKSREYAEEMSKIQRQAEDSVLTATDSNGKKLYSNSEQRENAVKNILENSMPYLTTRSSKRDQDNLILETIHKVNQLKRDWEVEKNYAALIIGELTHV